MDEALQYCKRRFVSITENGQIYKILNIFFINNLFIKSTLFEDPYI